MLDNEGKQLLNPCSAVVKMTTLPDATPTGIGLLERQAALRFNPELGGSEYNWHGLALVTLVVPGDRWFWTCVTQL